MVHVTPLPDKEVVHLLKDELLYNEVELIKLEKAIEFRKEEIKKIKLVIESIEVKCEKLNTQGDL